MILLLKACLALRMSKKHAQLRGQDLPLIKEFNSQRLHTVNAPSPQEIHSCIARGV